MIFEAMLVDDSGMQFEALVRWNDFNWPKKNSGWDVFMLSENVPSHRFLHSYCRSEQVLFPTLRKVGETVTCYVSKRPVWRRGHTVIANQAIPDWWEIEQEIYLDDKLIRKTQFSTPREG